MRKFVFALAATVALGLCVKFAQAAQEKEGKEQKVRGVLIDQKCGEKFKDESNPAQAASKHSAACALKCAKGGSDLVLMTRQKEMKLDKHGQELAMEYLGKPDVSTRVQVTGTVEGDEIKVTSIEKAPARQRSGDSGQGQGQ